MMTYIAVFGGKRASYRDAIGADIIPSVTASLIADIFGVTTERVTRRSAEAQASLVRANIRHDLAKGEQDHA